MTSLSRHDKHLMAAGIRWHLGLIAGVPPGLESGIRALFPAGDFAPGELEARRDELMSDPEFAEAYAAAATADGWRAFLGREEGSRS